MEIRRPFFKPYRIRVKNGVFWTLTSTVLYFLFQRYHKIYPAVIVDSKMIFLPQPFPSQFSSVRDFEELYKSLKRTLEKKPRGNKKTTWKVNVQSEITSEKEEITYEVPHPSGAELDKKIPSMEDWRYLTNNVCLVPRGMLLARRTRIAALELSPHLTMAKKRKIGRHACHVLLIRIVSRKFVTPQKLRWFSLSKSVYISLEITLCDVCRWIFQRLEMRVCMWEVLPLL